MTLALVLSTGDAADLKRAAGLARAARGRGVEVSMFLMDRAVDWIADATIGALVDDGCDVVACGTSATARGVTAPELGSQDDHAAIVSKADRVVAFT
jgi:sulfur relay (sulfurtransferase) complex TusBCD TusD component (DsrE family)